MFKRKHVLEDRLQKRNLHKSPQTRDLGSFQKKQERNEVFLSCLSRRKSSTRDWFSCVAPTSMNAIVRTRRRAPWICTTAAVRRRATRGRGPCIAAAAAFLHTPRARRQKPPHKKMRIKHDQGAWLCGKVSEYNVITTWTHLG